jgi:DNA invertase Pin-like site-specific DNA recombinase
METLTKNKIVRVALYARVSTSDKGQNPALQLTPLVEYCKQRGWNVMGQFVDIGVSGVKSKRPELDRLLDNARKRKLDVICVWKLDRFGRSMKHLVNTLEELQELGVSFVSYMESLDFTSATGKLMFNILAAFSQFERDIIAERVRAGMAIAKSKGVKIGRKATAPVYLAQVIKARENEKLSIRQIADKTRIPKSTVQRTLKQYKCGEISMNGYRVMCSEKFMH